LTINTLELLAGIKDTKLRAIAVQAPQIEHLVLPAHYIFDCLIAGHEDVKKQEREEADNRPLFPSLSSFTILRSSQPKIQGSLGQRIDRLLRSRNSFVHYPRRSQVILRLQEGLDLRDCETLAGVLCSSRGSIHGLLREYVISSNTMPL
jgi:hypothetical protein